MASLPGLEPATRRTMLTKISNSACITVGLMLLLPLGCKARELGSNYADTQATSVDNSWVTAVDSCWPAVAHQGYSTEAVKYYLADPIHFRAAFAVYAQFSDDTLRTMVETPVSNAPAADISVLQTDKPILTRVQAMTGVSDTSNRMPGSDSFCSIQPGLPVGFR